MSQYTYVFIYYYRAVAPVAPEEGFQAIRLATNPRSRKVEELQRDNQVFCFSNLPSTNVYVCSWYDHCYFFFLICPLRECICVVGMIIVMIVYVIHGCDCVRDTSL
jgi:hypothetical protein